jgi:hypothetical protein
VLDQIILAVILIQFHKYKLKQKNNYIIINISTGCATFVAVMNHFHNYRILYITTDIFFNSKLYVCIVRIHLKENSINKKHINKLLYNLKTRFSFFYIFLSNDPRLLSFFLFSRWKYYFKVNQPEMSIG